VALPLAKLRLYLSLIPLLRSRPGITFKEIGDHLGISAQAAQREIPEALMLCGVPPYLPHDYIACEQEGDRITVYFADHFRRPARITIGEVAAVILALRAIPPARGAPMAQAVAGLIRKLERALGSGEVRKLARRIGARRAPGALGRRMALVQQALDEQREIFVQYYTQRRRTLTERKVHPYALIDHLGHLYVVGRDSLRGREIMLRLDRMRSVEPTDKRFEKPKSFSAQRYRRADLYRPSPSDHAVRVQFGPGAARYVRELSPNSELKEKAGGAVERTLKTDSLRWVVDWSLQHGDDAEVMGPPAARKEAKKVLDDWLAFYRKHTK